MKQTIKITEKDCIEQLKGVPVPIVQRMVECQVEQGNPANIAVFQRNINACLHMGGFDWENTKEGFYNWKNALQHKNFDEFLKKYPVNEDIFEHIRFTAKLAKEYGFKKDNITGTYLKFLTKDSFLEFNAITKKFILQIESTYNSDFFKLHVPCYLDRIKAIHFAFTGRELKKIK